MPLGKCRRGRVTFLASLFELGRQLVAALLRQEGTTPAHLPALNVGLYSVRWRRCRRSRTGN
ncbi:DUF1612 domain-containing protein [Neorhizobium galegae]|uniref:DUF1612 domain-containing protein n=1 Tax=Neorhizobium galegae TaxID=399 RepID=UPI0012D45A7D|nr:DUF1612 domain-containing protein [Neorhizobium galegae]